MSSLPGPQCGANELNFHPGLARNRSAYTALHNKVKQNIAVQKTLKNQWIGLTICKPRSPTVVNSRTAKMLQNGHYDGLGGQSV
jgi:hypothetical protein